MTIDANKIIRNIAREKFIPQGLKQKGQSRLWFYPDDYYLILIEFQPSAWDKGTYLNVGLDFNWYPKDHFAFEFGHRIDDFTPLQDEAQFAGEIQRLCDLALAKVAEYKQIFSDLKTAGDKLIKRHTNKSNDWEKFNLGVLFAIGGHNDRAIELLKTVTGDHFKLDWEIDRASVARTYIEAIGYGDFQYTLNEMIKRTKELRKLG